YAPRGAPLSEGIAAQVGQQLFRIAKLRHRGGIAEVRHLDVAAAGKDELFEIVVLGRGGDEFLLVLEPVPYRYIPNRHLFGHPGKDLPVIVFGHTLFNLHSKESITNRVKILP